jgi:hypothetical protein
VLVAACEEETMPEEQSPSPDSNDAEFNSTELPNQATPSDKSLEQPISPVEPFGTEPPTTDEEWAILDTELQPPPATPPLPPKLPAGNSAAQSQTLQTLQGIWRTVQPKLRSGTVRVLKTTIQLLQGAVTQLESGTDAPIPAPPTTAPFERPSRRPPAGNAVQRAWQSFWAWWKGFLPTIRGILPTAINEALASDRTLSGVIAGVLVLVLSVTSSLFSSQPPDQVAIAPPAKTTPAKPTPTQEKKAPKPKNTPEVKVIPSPAPKPSPLVEEPKPQAENPTPVPTPTASPAPAPSPLPSPLPSPSPTPTPKPPPLKLTPEQTLIARIQDQVSEVSNQYGTGLIQSVQANFRSSRLTVKVGDGWYNLLNAQQDNLANDVLKRAQQLNFVKLEMVDAEGHLVARSPVIGAEMVVLQRSLASPTPKPTVLTTEG